MAFYRRIRDLREDFDKTQIEVAEHLKTTAQYYGKYEKGERELPFSRAIQLADFYNVSLDYIAERGKSKQEIILNDEEIKLLRHWRSLSERNRGKVEFLIEELLVAQKKNKN